MILMFQNLVDSSSAVLSASSADAEFPVTNLQNYLLSKVWKTTGSTTDEWCKFDLNAVTAELTANHAINACVLAGHNFDGTEVIKVQGNATDAWGSPTVNQTFTLKTRIPASVVVTPPYPAGTVLNTMLTFNSATLRYWRISITKANAADIRQIGRVYLGTSYDTGNTGDPDYGNYARTFNEMANIEKSITGQVYAERRALYDTPTMAIGPIPESVMQYLRYFMRQVGLSLPFFFRLSSTDPLDTPYYVRQQSPLTEALVEFGDSFLYNANLTLEEQL